MKKRALMALPKLTATDEMKQIATSDLPRKEKTDYGYVREVCEYYTYLRCIKQDGILKVAFFFPEHLRLDGSNPAYEVYLDKEKRQFITYNSLIQKWCESKLDRLDWKRQYWYMMSIQKPAVAEHSEDRVQDNPFVGKTIVVTGKVEPYTRDGINDLIESLGAHAGSSVSKKTDYLVCGENAGSKLSKARDLGVTVLSPAEFFSMAGAE